MLYPSRAYRARRRQVPKWLLTAVLAAIAALFPHFLYTRVYIPLWGKTWPAVGLGLATYALLLILVLVASELQRQLDCPMREADA